METAIRKMAVGSGSVGIGRNRDWELVRLVGRHGVMTIEQAMQSAGTHHQAGRLAEAEAADARIALCAPTGRAARRLEEATGHEAQTIHRMLEWMPGREPAFRPGHPLPIDLIIVDESSMLNLRLAEVLLGGLAETTHIVLVGDADQLPPIGAGKPFEDLIASGAAPVVRLSQIFRQAARSMITTAAHEINQGRQPHLEPAADQDHDFFFIDRPSPERALETVVEVVAERAADEDLHGLDRIFADRQHHEARDEKGRAHIEKWDQHDVGP